MGAEASDKDRTEISKAIPNTAPFFNLWCETDALLHSGLALSHVLVDCRLRNAVFPAGRGGFCQLEFAPLHPDTGENHNLGGKNDIAGITRHNAVYWKLQNDIHSSIPRRRLCIRGLVPLFCS